MHDINAFVVMSSSDFSDTIAIKVTRFFMRFTGFWIWDSGRGEVIMKIAMIYTIAAICFSWIVTVTDLWYSRQDFAECAYAACNSMTILIILMKLTIFSIRRDAFLKLIEFCYKHFWQRDYDSFGESILHDCEKRCTYFVCTFTFFAQCTVGSYTIQPFIENVGKNETDRVLPFNIWVNLPVTTTPYYEIIFFIEIMSMYHSGICYFCFDNFLCIMNVHVAGQFKLLQRKFTILSNLPKSNDYTDRTASYRNASILVSVDFEGPPMNLSNPCTTHYGEFKDCVRNHQSLILFTEMVEDVYTFVILGQVIIFSLLICLVSYQAALAEASSITRRAIFIIHSAGTFTQIFMFTLTCDDVMRQSEAVAEAAYNAHWHCRLFNRKDRQSCKDLIFVMMRARRPCCLTAGGFFPISLTTFTTILKTSMSYLTLLREGIN